MARNDKTMKEKIKKIYDFLEISNTLKRTTRWKHVDQMKQKESSADHSWHLAVFSWIVAEELEYDLDLAKIIKLAIVHDLPEAIAGDVDKYLVATGKFSIKEKESNELAAMAIVKKTLPPASSKEIYSLWQEYRDRKTDEAKFVYALDKIESIVHMINMGHESWHELNDFIGTYCHRVVAEFPALNPIHYELQKRLKLEFVKKGWEWKKEYEVDSLKNGNEKILNQELDSVSGTGRLASVQDDKIIPSNDKAAAILDFLENSEKLKQTKRFGKTPQMIQKETSADHSWQLSLWAIICLIELDLSVGELKSLKIALVHDLPEAFAGDTDSSQVYLGIVKKEDKSRAEAEALEKIVNPLPSKVKDEIISLWQEYEDAKTSEARFIKALDKIEGIHHMVCIGHECFDHPEWIAPHPNKAVTNFPELMGMLEELYLRLKPMYKQLGWKWRKEYEIM